MLCSLIFIVLLSLLSFSNAATVINDSKVKATKPNFIFILTDDQDRILGENGYSSLGSLEIMPNLQTQMIQEGAIVDNFLVNTPICCPSRTEFFTGRYFHNVGPPNEKGHCMHADTSFVADPDTGIFGLLTNNGYEVGAFGKVTNNQEEILEQLVDQKTITYIDSMKKERAYMGTEYIRYPNEKGKSYIETIDENDPIFGSLYQTSQLGNRTLRWLDDVLGKSLAEDGEARPFFAYIGPHAPHYPAQPAPWHEHAFDHINVPITPNYNVESPDKAAHVRQNPPLNEQVECYEDQHFRDRWASLLAVDDMIKEIYEYLEARMVLDNTYLIFSSDHGYKQGQWRIGMLEHLRILSSVCVQYCCETDCNIY
jgi:N-acetylglucosamine-6-sulfatase